LDRGKFGLVKALWVGSNNVPSDMAEEFPYRHRRTERLFKWVALFASILAVAVTALAIAQWNNSYDIRNLFMP
jgi:hypothetical protein